MFLKNREYHIKMQRKVRKKPIFNNPRMDRPLRRSSLLYQKDIKTGEQTFWYLLYLEYDIRGNILNELIKTEVYKDYEDMTYRMKTSIERTFFEKQKFSSVKYKLLVNGRKKLRKNC